MLSSSVHVRQLECLKRCATLILNRSEACCSSAVRLVKSSQPQVYQLENPDKYSFNIFASLDCESRRYAPKQLALLKTWYIIQKYIDSMAEIPHEIPHDMDLNPPGSVRGMTKLDKNAFEKKVLIPTLLVPFKSIGKLSQKFRDKGSLVRQPGIKPVAGINAGDNEREGKLFLFSPEKYKSVHSFSEGERQLLAANGVDLATWKLCEMDIKYANFTYHEIFDAVLPPESDGVAGFSTVGHIVHLNLKDKLLDFKCIIGEVLLDKVSTARTVVNKTSSIDNTYRNFKMELLAGEDDLVTTVKENGISYQMDFSKVYWNPRLATEHQRIVSLLQREDVVYDVFAGVGPFAVPASRRHCVVLANDLNPESFKWLEHNMKLNKIKSSAKVYNMDGRDFIRNIVKSDLLERWKQEKERNYSVHMVMNLPALAVEFLDALHGMMAGVNKTELKSMELPCIHCYSFSKSDDPKQDVRTRAEQALGAKLPDDNTVRFVRNVAPNKDMLCLSFVIPENVLFSSSSSQHTEEAQETSEEPHEKRCRLETSS